MKKHKRKLIPILIACSIVLCSCMPSNGEQNTISPEVSDIDTEKRETLQIATQEINPSIGRLIFSKECQWISNVATETEVFVLEELRQFHFETEPVLKLIVGYSQEKGIFREHIYYSFGETGFEVTMRLEDRSDAWCYENFIDAEYYSPRNSTDAELILILSYITGIGPTAAVPFSKVYVYSQDGNTFSYNPERTMLVEMEYSGNPYDADDIKNWLIVRDFENEA